MGFFGASESAEEREDRLLRIRDEKYKFIRVGRDRRVNIDQIEEYEFQSKNKVRVKLVNGEELLLGVDSDEFDAVVNASDISMNRLT